MFSSSDLRLPLGLAAPVTTPNVVVFLFFFFFLVITRAAASVEILQCWHQWKYCNTGSSQLEGQLLVWRSDSTLIAICSCCCASHEPDVSGPHVLLLSGVIPKNTAQLVLRKSWKCRLGSAEVTCYAVMKVPMLACTGNHEIEAESDGKNSMFTSVQARWKVLPGYYMPLVLITMF